MKSDFEYQNINVDIEKLVQNLDDKIAELERKLEIAKSALEFYAEENNWTAVSDESRYSGIIVGDYPADFPRVGGLRARKALEALK